MYAHSTKRHNNVEIIPFDNKTDALRSEQKHISLYSPKHNGRQGRPKLSKKEKKIIFSFKIKPELRDRINKKTKGVNRSAHVEKVLNDNY